MTRSTVFRHLFSSKLPVPFCGWIVWAGIAGGLPIASAQSGGKAPAPTTPPQIPLCMVGDSITWADYGDYWRKDLLAHIPTVAFIGTHSAALGFSHAGEGGNSTRQVLARMAEIPDSPYYSLLIGTNDNNIRDESAIPQHADATADRILQIVTGLLGKPGCRKVFLSSVLPCHTDNPLRDKTNAATDVALKQKLAAAPDARVVYVNYETMIRATPNWEPMIRLHPTPEGYRLLARVLADAIVKALDLHPPISPPVPRHGSGVRVVNLWQGDAAGRTSQPIIAGWYTLSYDVDSVTGNAPTLTLVSADPNVKQPLHQSFKLDAGAVGKRVSFEVYTKAEGYGYTRSVLALELIGCRISRILFEKKRPSGRPSVYGQGTYLDTTTKPSLGELVESR